MATFILFGNYTQAGLKAARPERTKKALKILRDNDGTLTAAYAMLGETDLLLVTEFPTVEAAMGASLALNREMGIAFRTAPAVPIELFDKLLPRA